MSSNRRIRSFPHFLNETDLSMQNLVADATQVGFITRDRCATVVSGHVASENSGGIGRSVWNRAKIVTSSMVLTFSRRGPQYPPLKMGEALIEVRNAILKPFASAGSSFYHLGRLGSRGLLGRGENYQNAKRDRSLSMKPINWKLFPCENWILVGPNGCGKSTFAQALRRRAHVTGGQIRWRGDIDIKKDVKYLSFKESDAALSFLARKVEEHGFWNRTKANDLVVCNWLEQNNVHIQDISVFGLEGLLNKSIGQLSTGQLRSLCLAKLLADCPKLCILDEPFDGLDVLARTRLEGLLNGIDPRRTQLLVIGHRFEELKNLNVIKNYLEMDAEGSIASVGKFPRWRKINYSKISKPSLDFAVKPSFNQDTLVDMENVSVSFGKRVVLSNVNWRIKKHDHCIVTGRNGVGKSLLLRLIVGDNVFTKDLWQFFGKNRRSFTKPQVDEMVGKVDSKIHSSFAGTHQSALDTICTGFYKVVGSSCPSPPTEQELIVAKRWADAFAISSDVLGRSFSALSQGQQRMVLCARACCTGPRGGLPPLLVFDEPFHNLDIEKVTLVKHILSEIQSLTTIILVSHHEQDIPEFITSRLDVNQFSLTTS